MGFIARDEQAPHELTRYRGFAITQHWDGYRWERSDQCFRTVAEVWKSIQDHIKLEGARQFETETAS